MEIEGRLEQLQRCHCIATDCLADLKRFISLFDGCSVEDLHLGTCIDYETRCELNFIEDLREKRSVPIRSLLERLVGHTCEENRSLFIATSQAFMQANMKLTGQRQAEHIVKFFGHSATSFHNGIFQVASSFVSDVSFRLPVESRLALGQGTSKNVVDAFDELYAIVCQYPCDRNELQAHLEIEYDTAATLSCDGRQDSSILERAHTITIGERVEQLREVHMLVRSVYLNEVAFISQLTDLRDENDSVREHRQQQVREMESAYGITGLEVAPDSRPSNLFNLYQELIRGSAELHGTVFTIDGPHKVDCDPTRLFANYREVFTRANVKLAQSFGVDPVVRVFGQPSSSYHAGTLDVADLLDHGVDERLSAGYFLGDDDDLVKEAFSKELDKLVAILDDIDEKQDDLLSRLEIEYDKATELIQIENAPLSVVPSEAKYTEADADANLTPGYLDLIVDNDKRTVHRKGLWQEVDLSPYKVLWHTFRVFFDAGDQDAAHEVWQNGYPGEWDARHDVVSRLRTAIVPLNIQISHRKRHFSDGISDVS